MKILFYKRSFAWPRSSGHDVHTYNMMRALVSQGHRVGLVTDDVPPEAALANVALDVRHTLASVDAIAAAAPLSLGRLEERFHRYWGASAASVSALGALASSFAADVVVVSGLDVLPLLSGVRGATRVWYAADEWFWHHVSQLRLTKPATWGELRQAAVKGLYERTFRRRIDRAWVVSRPDARALRLVAGVKHVDVLPNGVDIDWYQPSAEPEAPDTAVFWGRLDFGPNLQALEWFCREVWPKVRVARPGARFTIIGFNPQERARALARVPGVEMRPDLDDIRPEVAHHAVVALPFVSGGGIKNKLLEAAAMGKAIVCTRRTLTALNGEPPVLVPSSATAWAQALIDLWSDDGRRRQLGAMAREWVAREHTWDAAARLAAAGLLGGRPSNV